MAFTDLALGALAIFLATSAGSLFVYAFKNVGRNAYSALLAFAAGVMAFSVVELLIQSHASLGDMLLVLGLLAGFLALLVFEKTLPHIHILVRKKEMAVPKKKAVLLAGMMALHNIPEGLAVASAFAVSPQLGWLIASAIALQDIPEGLVVSAPLALYGLRPLRAVFFGVLSGLVEFSAAIAGYLLLSSLQPAIPFALAFSAGAMSYVILAELLPDAFTQGQQRVAAASFIAGIVASFALSSMLGFY